MSTVLCKIEESDLKINCKNCVFRVPNIILAGQHLSGKSIGPDSDQVKSITNLSAPKNLSALKSFLGTIKILPLLCTKLFNCQTPLRLLTKKKKKIFECTTEQETSFQSFKATLTNTQVMAFYNPQENTSITVDASPTGLGAILSQLQSNGTTKPNQLRLSIRYNKQISK